MALIINSSTGLTAPALAPLVTVPTLPVAGYTNRWDASVLTNLADGAAVATMPNLVSGGIGDMFQTTAANRPVVGTEGGYRHVAATTTSQSLQSATVSKAQPFTVVFVAKITSGVATATLVSSASSMNFGSHSSNKWFMSGGPATFTAGLLDANWHTFQIVYNGTSSVFRVDGTEYTGDLGVNNFQRHYWFMGALGSVRTSAVYYKALTAAERGLNHQHLKARYGLTA